MKLNLQATLRSLLSAAIILWSVSAFCQAPAAPSTCTAAIGTPANGTTHHITINWASVSGATAYALQYSYDNSTWNTADSMNVTTFDHNASNTGNVAVYYRVAATSANGESSFTNCSTFPIYTACDYPAAVTLSGAGSSTMNVAVPAESPTPNTAATTYAIYCTTNGLYVQANGALGASAVYQTRSVWGTTTITGLTASTSYCFYSIAKNGNGDTRIAPGSSISTTQTFDATGSLSRSNSAPTNVWWTPPTPTSGNPFAWSSTGGCSGGTGAGNVGFSGSFTNYFGSFLRSPTQNCTGNSAVVLSFDLTNSYIASHIVTSPSSCDACRFYMYINDNSVGYVNASSVKINGVEVSSTDGNGTWLKFDSQRSCTEVDVTFNLSSYSSVSNVFFYVEADDPYNDGNTFNVKIDNVGLSAGASSTCLSTTTCNTATISSNPTSQTGCLNGNTAFTVGTSGSVASYQWQVSTDNGATWNNVSNTSPYSNATTGTLNITGVTSGLNGYQYRCQVTGACSGTPTSTAATLTVGSAAGAAGTVTGSATVCQGQTGVAYSVGAVSGATGYTWALPTGATITSGSNTNNITVSFSNSATSGNVVVTPTNTCGNGTASTAFAVTVNPLPATLGSISGAASICSGVSQTYSVGTSANATSYIWTLPSGWSGTSTTNSITAMPSATSGSVTVTAHNGCGNTSAQTVAVTVSSTPATPGAISGSTTVCNGISTSYSVTAVNGATTYTWSLPNGWSGSSTTNSITVTPSSTAGNVSVTAGNGCGNSTAQSLAVTIGSTPATPGAITGATTACNANQLTYSVAPVNSATSYTWTLPNGWTGTSTADTIRATAGATGGNITVTANNGCGSSSAATLTISAGSAPATPGSISGSTTVCSGSAPTYSITAVNGATSYTWTLPGGWSGNSTSTSITPTAGANGGTLSVTANNGCGASSSSHITITVGTGTATPGSITGATTVCGNSNEAYSVATVNGATSYTWTLPNGWSGTSTTNSITATTGTTGGIVSVVANSACGASAASQLTVTASSTPVTPGAITGADTICNGTATSAYGVAAVNGATSYTWTLPNGWSGSSTTNTINANVGNAGGNIFVTANNGCGSSAAQSVAVVVASTPALPGAINGPDSICVGASAPYSIASVNGATSYNWILPNGWSGTSNTAILTTTAGAAGGNILVTANNGCGSSTAQSKAVNVNPLPQVTFNYTGGDICSNAAPLVLTTGSPTGGVYSGTSVFEGTFSPSAGAGNYVITYTVTSGYGCVNNDTATITVKSCTGIAEAGNSLNVQVFPNPFNDNLTITLTGNADVKFAVIYDMEGRELIRTEISGNLFEMHTGNLARGVYLLNMVSSDAKNIGWKKLVKGE